MELIRYIKTTLGPKILKFESIADEIKSVYDRLSSMLVSVTVTDEQLIEIGAFKRVSCTNSGIVNVVIDSGIKDGQWVVVSDGYGKDRGKNNIIITTKGSEVFQDGSAEFRIDLDNDTVKLQKKDNKFYLTGV
jgi:hypothetical protein